MMKYNFTDKRIWLTGASSGIGLALAHLLLNNNAKVALSARNEQRLNEHFKHHTNALILPVI
ncbi:SDR family NAD(P)-dependent oxidoreductase [Aliikangiella maris]|uniref:SDR family NAD(P)-dependent oxidoreductase n=2 Tax=Aliikangiella maris TaxID=3162458 RepID=A0ABV3MNK2_9GAMM